MIVPVRHEGRFSPSTRRSTPQYEGAQWNEPVEPLRELLSVP